MAKNEHFSFEISLSILNHLGRNLYRSFVTVLGEAISNSWDADAENVWVYINREKNSLVIKDDGQGMDKKDFQNKFLKIGYSKRNDGNSTTEKGRPFIGRKGIGKLALLSCAERVTVLSKKIDSQWVGGIIDNTGLDKAITDDLTASEYLLGNPNILMLEEYTNGLDQGTILIFENIKDGIRNSINYLKKLIALYFRFSLLDDSFSIFVGDEEITHLHLDDLSNKTQFMWAINDLDDPYMITLLKHVIENDVITSECSMKGFIASVDKPLSLKVITTEEKVSVDLFVNGRLREKDIFRHKPSARIVESYLYGQIHFNELDADGEADRFASSREGVVADDTKFEELLIALRNEVLPKITEDWDQWRLKHKKTGDPENPRISPKERKSRELFDIVSQDYSSSEDAGRKKKKKIDHWLDDLVDDAQFNFSSYAECFISENLIRKYIDDQKYPLSEQAIAAIVEYKKREAESKGRGNISIELREHNVDLSYLSMDDLANLVDRKDPLKDASLRRDACEYKPIRDALMHTARLAELAKDKLTTVHENIKGRIVTLLPDD